MDEALTIPNKSFFKAVEDYLIEGKSIQIKVKGNSMLPFLFNGDNIELSKIEKGACKIGEVVLAKWKDGYVLHRVIFKGRKRFYLVGDNNLFQIERINPESVIARVISAHREGSSIDIQKIGPRIKGICWFLLRPFRWIMIKLKKSK